MQMQDLVVGFIGSASAMCVTWFHRMLLRFDNWSNIGVQWIPRCARTFQTERIRFTENPLSIPRVDEHPIIWSSRHMAPRRLLLLQYYFGGWLMILSRICRLQILTDSYFSGWRDCVYSYLQLGMRTLHRCNVCGALCVVSEESIECAIALMLRTCIVRTGPGGSSIYGQYGEMGYFQVDDNGTAINPFSWNRVANMLYLESPAGSSDPIGFSSCTKGTEFINWPQNQNEPLQYKAGFDTRECNWKWTDSLVWWHLRRLTLSKPSTNLLISLTCIVPDGRVAAVCSWNDTSQAEAYAHTLQAFYKAFPEFASNDLYISGESYAGQYIPNIAYYIVSPPMVVWNSRHLHANDVFCVGDSHYIFSFLE